MRRTQENTDITQHFTGIQEVGAEFGSRIDEIHGMYDKSMTSLTRIPGKLLMTTGIADGPIWSLHQLKFQDGSVRLSKEGGNYQAERFDLPPSGNLYPYPSFTNYPSPGFQIQNEDWPVNYNIPVWSSPTGSPTYSRAASVLNFYGMGSSSQTFYILVENSWEPFSIQDFGTLPDWLTISSPETEGVWSGSHVKATFTVTVDPSAMGYLPSSFTIPIQLMSKGLSVFTKTVVVNMLAVSRKDIWYYLDDTFWNWDWEFGMIWDDPFFHQLLTDADVGFVDPYYIEYGEDEIGIINLFYRDEAWYIFVQDEDDDGNIVSNTVRLNDEDISWTDEGVLLWSGTVTIAGVFPPDDFNTYTIQLRDTAAYNDPVPDDMGMQLFYGCDWNNNQFSENLTRVPGEDRLITVSGDHQLRYVEYNRWQFYIDRDAYAPMPPILGSEGNDAEVILLDDEVWLNNDMSTPYFSGAVSHPYFRVTGDTGGLDGAGLYQFVPDATDRDTLFLLNYDSNPMSYNGIFDDGNTHACTLYHNYPSIIGRAFSTLENATIARGEWGEWGDIPIAMPGAVDGWQYVQIYSFPWIDLYEYTWRIYQDYTVVYPPYTNTLWPYITHL